MTVFVDTNVILDYVLKREPHAEAARECLDRLIISKAKVWLSASTITDIYYVTRRGLQDAAKAKDVIAKLLNAFQIVGVDKNDCISALGVPINDYEDALVTICAKKIKVDFVLSRNTDDFKGAPIKAIHPDDFLKM